MSEKESWRTYDDFLMQGTLDRYTKLWARYELFQRVVDLPGDIVECGVLNGGGVLYWARLLQVFNPLSQRKVIGFDTFEGYPESMKGEQDKKTSDSFLKAAQYTGASPEKIMETAAALGLDRWIELVKGDATVAIKKYVQENIGFRAALLNLDFDIYEPTLAALECLYYRVVPRGIIAFDEYAVHQWGEALAVDEFFKGKNIVLKAFPWGFSPTAYMVKDEPRTFTDGHGLKT
ncbi:MAG: class I SAM-dependent methyltransferase [Candidatus Aminicenantes bacterium]|nr:class I SAM-dependent methyltransferase [Candidatus Aminicenantes bacterium]